MLSISVLTLSLIHISFERYFDSFDHYYTIYQQRNTELWIEYGEGKITKDELNLSLIHIYCTGTDYSRGIQPDK